MKKTRKEKVIDFGMYQHNLFTQMKHGKDKILWLLTQFPKSRDDDSLLYSYYIIYEVGQGNFEQGKQKLNSMTALQWLREFADHEFMNYASLIRARRLIQANPVFQHLRGTKAVDRQVANEFWRQNINK